MSLWQQADPSYEIAPPPAVFRMDRSEHYFFSKSCLLMTAFQYFVNRKKAEELTIEKSLIVKAGQ
jgi:hypothetical protein